MRSFRHYRPRYLVDRIAQSVRAHLHPNEPWIAGPMVDVLESWLRKTDVGLEFGSGRSTSWFAERVAFLTSVELDPVWYDRVLAKLQSLGLEKSVRLVRGAESYADPNDPILLNIFKDIPAGSLDFCLIDGGPRAMYACKVLPLLKPEGIVILDNAQWFIPPPIRKRSPNTTAAPLGPLCEAFCHEVATWRCIWCSDGVNDTSLWQKPGAPAPSQVE